MLLQLDHVLLAVSDLELGAERLRKELGLDSHVGGRHEGTGTHNRIVPLGDDYIELVGIAEPAEADGSAFGRLVHAGLRNGDGLAGWCVRVDDLDEVCSRLDLVSTAMSRIRQDGSALEWRLAGVEVAEHEPSLPFFISWDIPGELHPGRTVVEHAVEPMGIASVEVAGDEQRLRDWLGGADLPVRVVPGTPEVRAVEITTRSGKLVLR